MASLYALLIRHRSGIRYDMMNVIWSALCIVGLCWGMASGRSALLTAAALSAVQDAIQLSIKLAGGFAFWSGMLCIVEKSGIMNGFVRALSPVLRRLFPDVSDQNPARDAMAMNMAANMLGLGNAATPMGLRAVRLLSEQDKSETATDSMCMFLVINASSLQLFPTTVIALRAAAGSSSPASILWPTLASTAISTLAGILACWLLSKWGGLRNG